MEVEKVRVLESSSVMEAIAAIDRAASGAALILDASGKLVGILTDGDIRRAILQHFDLARPASELLKVQSREFGPTPLSLPASSQREDIIAFMVRHSIRHLPLLDGQGRVVALVTRDELLGAQRPRIRGVIMAGGFGTRLRPLTEGVPKPMLALGGKPVLEHLLEKFKQYGIEDVTLVLHYKKEIIQEYFGDGSRFGIDIDYVEESAPRGTAGAISDIAMDDRLLLVANGDIVTTVNFEQMEQFHRQHDASLTVAVVSYESIIPYGVIEMQAPNVTQIVEKPRSRHFINAGMYLMSPRVRRFIPGRGAYDMTDLVRDALAAGETVLGFPVREYWLDIGQHDDYERAELDLKSRQ